MQLLWVISVLCTVLQAAKNMEYNNRPIIGILAQDTKSGNYHDTYIPGNYVKFLEQAGARVVPIRVREKPAYYEELCKHINGALFPGGWEGIISSHYAKAARIIYDLAIKANDAGDHFPLWGTCRGFQLMTNLTARKCLLKRTDSYNMSLPLKFAPGFKSSQMFQRLSANLLHILSSEPVTPNFHNYGLLVETFHQTKSLNTFYRLLSSNTDRQGTEFVTTIEAYKYPFYGTQWHPEKLNFEWNPIDNLDHGSNGVLVAHYFSSFFVSSARRSNHTFPKPEDEALAVIENYLHVYADDGSYGQFYFLNFTTEQTTTLNPNVSD